ncbi:MAG: helix-turn-helix domain-containing protein [Pirellula sp.]|jgi:excisionase family DNA binding protein|nr:helix-turn-helix domain-containing protein [Pirellula sp.]
MTPDLPIDQYTLDRLADAIADRLLTKLSASDGLVDSDEAAKLASCSRSSIERAARDGRLPSTKIGRLRRYRKSDVLRLQQE